MTYAYSDECSRCMNVMLSTPIGMLNFHQTFIKRNKFLLCCLSERYFAKIHSLAKFREMLPVHANTTHIRHGMENPAISWVNVLGGLATLNYLQWWIILNGLGSAH